MRKYLLLLGDMKLSKRLLIAMLTIGLVPLAMVGVISYISGSNALYSAELSKLDAVRGAKKDQIEAYFEQIKNQIITMSENGMIIEAMKGMTQAMEVLPAQLSDSAASKKTYSESLTGYYRDTFNAQYLTKNSLPVETSTLQPKQIDSVLAQYLYISQNPYPLGNKDMLNTAGDSSAYSALHQKYHGVIRNYLKKFGYYDIFLIEPKKGKIVYSVFKEIDFATNLVDGPYRDTNLANVFRKARNFKSSEQVVLVDFAPYLPSYNGPASFIGAPIFDDEELVGVLAYQMPIGSINNIMQKTEGLGESGETYLVGSDGLMRSQSRFTQSNTVLDKKVATKAVEKIRNEQSGNGTIFDYRGIEVLSSFSPLRIEGLNWGIIAEIDEKEALSAIKLSIYIDLIIALISLVFVVITALYLARSISKPVIQAVKIAGNIASGRLDNTVEISTKCEVGDLLQALDTMQSNLNARIANDRRILKENIRIKQALDNVSGNMLVVGNDHNVLYLNRAMGTFLQCNAAEFKHINRQFDESDLLQQPFLQWLPEYQQALTRLLDDEAEYRLMLQVGPLNLLLVSNPVKSDSAERLGTVIELIDRTLELATEQEVQRVVESALAGDLTKRINIEDKTGFFANLSNGVNQLVDVSELVINDTQRVIGAIAKGDLSQKIDNQYSGSFELLKESINSTVQRLTQVVEHIQRSSKSVTIGANEISQANQKLNRRTEEQSASLQQTAASMEVFTQVIQDNATVSRQASKIVQQARESAQKGGRVIEATISAMGDIDNSSKEISEIVSVIDSMSFQINLLALNAAVEAARVGDQGKGFGVVASEVRSLARLSAESAKEIARSIEKSNLNVKEGMRLARESGDVLKGIVTSINSGTEHVEKIALTSAEQSRNVNEINTAINYIDEITVQNAAMVEQASQASELLGEQAQQLDEMTAFFSLKKAPVAKIVRRSELQNLKA